MKANVCNRPYSQSASVTSREHNLFLASCLILKNSANAVPLTISYISYVETTLTCSIPTTSGKLVTLFAKKMNEKEKRKLKKPIEDYEMERERFLNDTLVIEFHRTVVINPAELSQKTKLMIKVSDRFASKRTLKDIEQLALNAFVECHKSLMCMHATVGSMVISWFIPEGQSDKFEALAKKNIVVFKDAGVEEVTVGGRVVFSSTLEEVRTSHGIDNLSK